MWWADTLALVVSCGVMPVACAHGPCFDVRLGDRFAITVVEPYNTTSHYTYVEGPTQGCGFGFDVSAGLVLHAHVVGSDDSEPSCKIATPSFAPFGNWIWTVKSPTSGFSAVLAGTYEASSPGCSGPLELEFMVVGPDPFAPSVPGHVPNVVMARNFSGGSPGDAKCFPCSGFFVVNVARE